MSWLTFAISFLLSGVFAGLMAGEKIFLHSNWELQSVAKIADTGERISLTSYEPSGWYGTTVPRTVLAALVDNRVYPDPFFGLNLKSIPGYVPGRWLVMREDNPFYPPWWYRAEFEVASTYRGKNIFLHIDGINYRANIWFNGHQVASSDSVVGMFRRFEFDVTALVRFGEANCLAIEVIAPGKLPRKNYRTKQIEATTGWDDHNPQPPDMNMGVWRNVYLQATGPLRIKYPYVAARLELQGLEQAHLTITAEVQNISDRNIKGLLTGSMENISFTQPVELAPHQQKQITFSPDDFPQLNIDHPRVWWPHPVGPQELYHLNLTLRVNGTISDADSVRFGIRQVTSYLNEEGWRVYKVNGRKILIRGGAWMTSDMLLRLTHRRYDALIRYAREANLNMLRSEGFSIRETEDFYNLCDEYGVMVTQQIFGRSIPDEKLAVRCINDMILRIRNHPSLVHFLGHDETFPTPTLDRAYRDLIARYTPERTYQPHSGAFDINNRFKTGGTRTGTRELWTYANPAHYYTHKKDGAWGFAQSGGIGGVFASLESIRRMMPAESLWPLWTEAWSFHTVIQGGHYFDALMNALNRRYGTPSNLDELILKGQVMNYESARGMFEAYARNKYAATGITTWKYDAAWPAALTWQYVDWYLLPTGAYYGAQKACQPLHAQYAYDDHSVYVVNSFYSEYKDLTVSAKIYNIDMEEKYSHTEPVNVAADGKTKAFTLSFPQNLSKTFFLKLALFDASGKNISDNFYWLSTVPDIPGKNGYKDGVFFIHPESTADFGLLEKLPQVHIEANATIEKRNEEQVVHVTVRNPTSDLAFFINVAILKGEDGLQVAPTFWQENDISLLPGEERVVQGVFYERDLQKTFPVLRVKGWNVRREIIPIH